MRHSDRNQVTWPTTYGNMDYMYIFFLEGLATNPFLYALFSKDLRTSMVLCLRRCRFPAFTKVDVSSTPAGSAAAARGRPLAVIEATQRQSNRVLDVLEIPSRLTKSTPFWWDWLGIYFGDCIWVKIHPMIDNKIVDFAFSDFILLNGNLEEVWLHSQRNSPGSISDSIAEQSRENCQEFFPFRMVNRESRPSLSTPPIRQDQAHSSRRSHT